MEASVVDVCGSFNGMATRARETVAQTSQVVGRGGANTVDNLIETSSATIQRLVERMEASSQLSLQAAERIESLEGASRRILQDLAEVENIAFRNKLVALNAKIEAVHVGEAGAGFGVVADEISEQARRSGEMAEKIGEAVREMSSAVFTATGELRKLAENDQALLEQSRAEVNDALASLRTAHEGMAQAVSRSNETGEALAAEISRAVMAMQFQDRLGQRIAHVVDALEAMEASFAMRLREPAAPDPTGGTDRADPLSKLRDSYTMHAERTVAAQPGDDVASEAEDCDVELF